MSKKSRKANIDTMWPQDDSAQANRLMHSFALIASNSDDHRITGDDRQRYDELSALALDKRSWSKMPLAKFQFLLFQQVVASAWDGAAEPVFRMMEMYKVAIRRMTTGQRQNLAASVASKYSLFGNSFGRLFFPFGNVETEPGVIARAALEFAQYFSETNEDGTLLNGPEALATVVTARTVMHPGPVLGGVLMLGDKRNLPLLEGTWKALNDQDQLELSRTNSGFMYAATIEYLLRWMEDVDEAQFAFPSVMLATLRKNAARDTVFDVERDLPVPPHKSDGVVRFVNEWPAKEYGKLIESRLRALAEREVDDEIVIPMVMEAWGLSWEPENEDQRQRYERTKFNLNLAMRHEQRMN